MIPFNERASSAAARTDFENIQTFQINRSSHAMVKLDGVPIGFIIGFQNQKGFAAIQCRIAIIHEPPIGHLVATQVLVPLPPELSLEPWRELTEPQGDPDQYAAHDSRLSLGADFVSRAADAKAVSECHDGQIATS